MEAEELNFKGNDPGAVKYGNFINYYSFHSTTWRIENLCPEMFPTETSNKPMYCLDIGCNTGELTKEFYLFMKNIYPNCEIHMLAIDIDPSLIQRAQETNIYPNITYKALNIIDEETCRLIQEYLNTHDNNMFDVTSSFSVTMWIHINNGDNGLIKFLHYLKSISRTIIIEPQPWSCYRNAQRRLKKSGSTFPFYEIIKIRSNVDSMIEEILLQDNTHKKVYESLNSKWQRKIQSYNINVT